MQKHSYTKFGKTPFWKIIESAVADLEQNGDIELKTGRENVIGYLVKCLSDKQDKPS